MKLQIFHTVNAGLYLWNGRSGLLIDGLHGGKQTGFSDTPSRYIHMMEKGERFFGQKNDLLFTHTHEDHYDPELAERFLQRNPQSLIWGPGLDRNGAKPVVLETGVSLISIRDYRIYAFATRHDGEAFADCPHDSYLIRWEGQSLWVSGDAVLDRRLAEQVRRVCGTDRPGLAFVMVYQIGSRRGREFLKCLSPEKICLYHLPYPEDDRFHYRQMARGLVQRCRQEGILVSVPEPDSFVER